MRDYVVAIDQGTTSTRCMVFDHSATVVGICQMEHRQIYPRPGWVEHDPLEIWECTRLCIEGALQTAGVGAESLVAVGVTNQRETTLAWNRRTGRPYANALVWQDTRTAALCEKMARDGGPDRFRTATGLPIATYFAAPKMRWLLDHVDGLRRDAEAGDAVFGTVDTWLLWNLAGGVKADLLVTDVTNASRTLLMDLQRQQWDGELLEAFGVPPRSLASIRASGSREPFATTVPDGPFAGRVPVCAILGDQQAATVGQTCFSPGEAKNTYGTGCFLLMNTGDRLVASENGLLTTIAYQFAGEPPVYALEGSVAVAGALVQWLRDNLGLISSSAEIEELARSVPDNGGVYFVPAFSGLFAPHWRSDARGVVTGLTRHSNKGHLARAALEATAFQTREILEAMERDAGVALPELRVDGGMVVNELLMQFQADILGVPVTRPQLAETTALGSAYAAGLAVGFWSDTEELRRKGSVGHTWQPATSDTPRERMYADWQRAIQRSLGWIQEEPQP